MAARAVRVYQGHCGRHRVVLPGFPARLGLTRTLLNNIGQIYRNSLYLEGLFEFLEDLKPEVISPPEPGTPLHAPYPQSGFASTT